MSWLPLASTVARPAGRAWAPAGIEPSPRLRYLVIDEIVGAVVGLALCPWPSIDEQGRLRFSVGAQTLGAGRDELQRFLASHRRPPETATRPIRIGDVFAVEVIPAALAEVGEQLREQRRLEPLLAPADWIEPPLVDLTATAREAAKISFYAAVAPTLAPERASALSELTAASE